jgi:hypothetical protein
MNTGVKVLLAVLIIALALDVTLIVLKQGQSNPKPETEVAVTKAPDSIGSSLIFNFSDSVNHTGNESAGTALDGLSEEEIGAMAMSEESRSESDGELIFTGD